MQEQETLEVKIIAKALYDAEPQYDWDVKIPWEDLEIKSTYLNRAKVARDAIEPLRVDQMYTAQASSLYGAARAYRRPEIVSHLGTDLAERVAGSLESTADALMLLRKESVVALLDDQRQTDTD